MTHEQVVVGIDESRPALAALRAAADEAALRGVGLRAINVQQETSWATPPSLARASTAMVRERLQAEVDDLTTERSLEGKPPVDIRLDIIEGEPERELLSAGVGAALLVVGGRRHRTPSEVVVSTAELCAANPPCPVLIVPMANA
jgi:nucleotide-binding universal stress UspA family protein